MIEEQLDTTMTEEELDTTMTEEELDTTKIPNGPRVVILDDYLDLKDKLNMRAVSRCFCNHYASFFQSILSRYSTDPLYEFIIQIFKGKKYLPGRFDKNTQVLHLELATQFSNLLRHGIKNTFEVKRQASSVPFYISKDWLIQNPDFVKTLKKSLTLPTDFDIASARAAVTAETTVWDDYHGVWDTFNPATAEQKRNDLIDRFKKSESDAQLDLCLEIIQGILPKDMDFLRKQAACSMINQLGQAFQTRLKDALEKNKIQDKDIVRDIYEDILTYCMNKFYNIKLTPLKSISYTVKETLPLLGIPRNAKIQAFDSYPSSSTHFAMGITLANKADADEFYQKLVAINIKAVKGKIKDSDQWSLQIKDYFPIELINAFSSFNPSKTITFK